MLFFIALTCLIFDNAIADRGFYENNHRNNDAIAERPVVRTNFSQMINWLTNLAMDGNVELQVFLGNVYFYGYEINIDYHEAKRWYKIAANNGNREAQNKLAYMYEKGLGCRKSNEKSYYWRNITTR